MMTDKLNKAKVLMAQGQNELSRIKLPLQEGFHAKVRTICRRAAGFYISAYLEIFPKENYGSSFMNQLRSVAADKEIPENIRNYAGLLITKQLQNEITGKQALTYCNKIINYFNILIKKEFIQND